MVVTFETRQSQVRFGCFAVHFLWDDVINLEGRGIKRLRHSAVLATTARSFGDQSMQGNREAHEAEFFSEIQALD